MPRSKSSKDSEIEYITQALKISFAEYKPIVYVTRRRKDSGYIIQFSYTRQEGSEDISFDAIYQALANSLIMRKDGEAFQATLDDIKQQFTVKHILHGGTRPEPTTVRRARL